MGIQKLNEKNKKDLYDYWRIIKRDIPFKYQVSYDEWYKSMFEDIDGHGDRLFQQIETDIVFIGDQIKGFIQYGIPNFEFNSKGKSYEVKIGIIRNLHYEEKDEQIGQRLLENALKFFSNYNINHQHAFYHYFGMSCNGRHGKLHDSCLYIENLLKKYDFMIEHENVYYSKDLMVKRDDYIDEAITFVYQSMTKGNQHYISFYKDDVEIGGAEVHAIANCNICYLRLIYIKNDFNHQGLGTRCLRKLCYDLKIKGYTQLDTDTAINNVNAQKFYQKLGFDHKGITRSYKNY